MAPTYEQNKKHIYKYRSTHPEKHREIDRRHKSKAYAWKKIQKMFLNILLEP